MKKRTKLECAVDSTPWQIPMLSSNVANSMKDKLALAHPYYDWSHVVSFKILTRGLGGDGATDRLTDALSHPYHKGKSCSKFG